MENVVFCVFRRPVTPEQFAQKATRIGLRRANVREGDGVAVAHEEIWTDQGQSIAVHYIDDRVTGMQFLCVRGRIIVGWLGDLAQRFELWDDADVVKEAMTATSNDRLVDAIFRVAVTFHVPDERIAKIFETYVRNSPYPQLRMAGLNAMAYRHWPSLRPIVAAVAAEDADESVRAEAARLLPLFAENSDAPS